MDQEEKYRRAMKRVAALKRFYSHFFIYAAIIIMLFVIDLLDQSGNFWFYWPLLGWGIAIVAHAFAVFGCGGLFGPEWEKKKIKEMMDKLDEE